MSNGVKCVPRHNADCSGTPFEHAPERKSCDYCPERFYSRRNLNHHEKFAHKDHMGVKYECNKCQLTWNAQKDWIDHKKSHKEGRPDQEELAAEILNTRKKDVAYANNSEA